MSSAMTPRTKPRRPRPRRWRWRAAGLMLVAAGAGVAAARWPEWVAGFTGAAAVLAAAERLLRR